MDLQIFPIHKKKEYLMDCCTLINEEWKRSVTARLRSLENSCDYLPVNIVLLKDKEVIGHAKLSKIPTMKDCCFVESVVIKNNLRGKGYGSYLMNKIEEYCKNVIHLKIIYLSTKGQEKFYQKLGYMECEPIQLYGTPVLNTNNTAVFKIMEIAPPPPLKNNLLSSNVQKTYMAKHLQNCIDNNK